MIVNHGKMEGHKTLNQQVPGSIPGRPTSKFKHLSHYEVSAFLFWVMYGLCHKSKRSSQNHTRMLLYTQSNLENVDKVNNKTGSTKDI